VALGVIPARYGSTRFPGKVLYPLAGKPMIQWVWERVRRSALMEDVIIATDSPVVMDIALGFGATAVMTDPAHSTGTSRVIEAVQESTTDIVVNVQGDEPLVQPELLDNLITELRATSWASIATPAIPITSSHRLADPNVVKLVMNRERKVLYFSRAAIPHGFKPTVAPGLSWEHQGIYAFRYEALMSLGNSEPTCLELAESLEQLRFLESGLRIVGVVSTTYAPGVNTPEDVPEVEHLLREGGME
jgi:3-deoxy-manno-octulosonate cytidylyltransferase (CMP-KDO synthetase)